MNQVGESDSTLLWSCSSQSLADENETISEAEEIKEVEVLLEYGHQAAEKSNFDEAIKYYNEALQIDSKNVIVLKSRAWAYLQQWKTEEAAKDAEEILTVDPNSSQAYFLKGLIYDHIKLYKPSLNALLTALDLDPSAADKLTYQIAQTVSTFCQVSSNLTDSLQAMEPYERLSEVGVILFQNKKYATCIDVLDAAEKFQTNRREITKQNLFTQASANCELHHYDIAIELYQKCFNLAMATQDQVYQTKSLVNIATLYLDSGDTYQAIVFYEKILHLEIELLSEVDSDSAMPKYWTQDLQCGLHLNLSIAYKTIGNLASAIVHAKKYIMLAEKFGLEAKLVAESHHKLGMLLEMSGNYQGALQCFKEYLTLSQNSGNVQSIGQAYGCLARTYAAIRNWSISLSYHDQYIAIATTSKQNKMMADAYEIKADTLCFKGDYMSATEQYSKMWMLCQNHDSLGEACSLLKMAKAYRNLGQTQYSLHYCNEALSIAQRFGLREIETMSEFLAAFIKKDSSQSKEREEARMTFMKLIPFYERTIAHHREKNNQCSEEYEQHLSLCYDGMQTILSLMPNTLECLYYAEAHRRFSIMSFPDFQSVYRVSSMNITSISEIWDTDYIKSLISEENATILYYSVLESQLLLWVLQPVEGIVHFYVKRAFKDLKFTQQISALLLEMRDGWDRMEFINTSEARALPHRNGEIMHQRSQNLRLSSEKTESTNKASSSEENKPALQRLYDLLVAPVNDVLDKLEKGSHLMVVPDKQLQFCPFGALLDNKNKPFADRFKISYIPCLLFLDQVIKNERTSVFVQNDLQFQQQQPRKEVLSKEIYEQSETLTPDTNLPGIRDLSKSERPCVNLREVSNPRLASLRAGVTSVKSSWTDRSRESTFHSTGSLSSMEIPTSVAVNGKFMKHLTQSQSRHGYPTDFERHICTTLTTRPWTSTDITSSTQVVTQFKQIGGPRTALVFGSPKINQGLKIHDKEWVPKSDLSRAQKELILVAECLGTYPIMGKQATKRKLLCRLETAVVVHIVTWACLDTGLLLVTPDSLTTNECDNSSYLVTMLDILNLKLRAKLVVLSSCGLTPARADQECTMKLASSFLFAGAECVLMCMWPVPDDTLCKFMLNFYLTFQNGEFVSEALHNGIKSIQDDGRWKHVCYWGCYAMIGKDTRVNINEIRHAHLDQIIDKCEKVVDNKEDKFILNPKSAVLNVASKDENLKMLQKHMKNLLLHDYKSIPGLVDLLDSSLKRLHMWKNNYQPVQLSEVISSSPNSLALLKWLGFHFQAKGNHLAQSYIIFPHWDTDDFLMPAYNALKAATELISSARCVTVLCEVLPLAQNNISSLIDLLCISKHAPEIQLRVTDLSVQQLWQYTKTRVLLSAVGYHQVGLLLTFNMTSMHNCYRNQILLHKLDMDLLGRAHDTTKSSETSFHTLPSLGPVVLHNNELRLSTPWLSVIEHRDEMQEKIRLAKSMSDLNKDNMKCLQRAKTWHQMSIVAQANETQDKCGHPSSKPRSKVKVKSGSTLSQRRIPVDEEKQLTNIEISQRRDYAHFVLKERLGDIASKRRDGIIKLYLPYVKS